MQTFFKMANCYFKKKKTEKGCCNQNVIKKTAKDVKEVTYIPQITFVSVLERPGKKNVRGVATTPFVRRVFKYNYCCAISSISHSNTESQIVVITSVSKQMLHTALTRHTMLFVVYASNRYSNAIIYQRYILVVITTICTKIVL